MFYLARNDVNVELIMVWRTKFSIFWFRQILEQYWHRRFSKLIKSLLMTRFCVGGKPLLWGKFIYLGKGSKSRRNYEHHRLDVKSFDTFLLKRPLNINRLLNQISIFGNTCEFKNQWRTVSRWNICFPPKPNDIWTNIQLLKYTTDNNLSTTDNDPTNWLG